jgi:hypothetical protein
VLRFGVLTLLLRFAGERLLDWIARKTGLRMRGGPARTSR